MAALPRTRAAVSYVMNHAHGSVTRRHAAELSHTLVAYETVAVSRPSDQSALLGLLRMVVIGTRTLAGRAWLRRNLDTPYGLAFASLLNTGQPPPSDDLDDILAGVLWARFQPRRLSARPQRLTAQPRLG